jgi:hypothetical protein
VALEWKVENRNQFTQTAQPKHLSSDWAIPSTPSQGILGEKGPWHPAQYAPGAGDMGCVSPWFQSRYWGTRRDAAQSRVSEWQRGGFKSGVWVEFEPDSLFSVFLFPHCLFFFLFLFLIYIFSSSIKEEVFFNFCSI